MYKRIKRINFFVEKQHEIARKGRFVELE